MSTTRAQQIADAVLLGSDLGLLVPRAWADHQAGERWWLQAQVLIEGRGARLQGQLRFAEAVTRYAECWDGDRYVAMPSGHDDRDGVAGEELRLREVGFRLDVELGGASFFFDHGELTDIETLVNGDAQIGRLRRTRRALRGVLRASTEPLPSRSRGLHRVTLRVENLSVLSEGVMERREALASAFASTHLVLEVLGGELISLSDPPQHARVAADQCQNVGVHPTIVSDRGAYHEMLCAPIYLPDHPVLAPGGSGGGALEAP